MKTRAELSHANLFYWKILLHFTYTYLHLLTLLITLLLRVRWLVIWLTKKRLKLICSLALSRLYVQYRADLILWWKPRSYPKVSLCLKCSLKLFKLRRVSIVSKAYTEYSLFKCNANYYYAIHFIYSWNSLSSLTLECIRMVSFNLFAQEIA